ncbi:DPY30 domain-containing protein 1-like [Bombus affinis]|uniref:DPY30 domain-containing protein 1-like n=1 Tax=Bombus affinis TaxID=309941 RepID=UPI0021B7AD1F|nr:DPY30 domain-containing protein 1-like [Bombus affinis]
MLTILHSTRSQLGCLRLITISGRCDEMNNEIKKTSKDYDDNDKKVDETLIKVCNKLNIIRSDDTEEKMLEEESETLCSMSLTDEVELSFDGKWLRKYFKLPLKMGIKEIVARKPCDPVTYLGFWLLNYKRCQECKQWQLEKDNELNYLRSMIEEPVYKEEEFSVSIREEEEEEEEEGMRDWNFKRYETMHA